MQIFDFCFLACKTSTKPFQGMSKRLTQYLFCFGWKAPAEKRHWCIETLRLLGRVGSSDVPSKYGKLPSTCFFLCFSLKNIRELKAVPCYSGQ
jgi:hypothetical protein